jgi:7,8-dihydro-6-hydroxymethylpterin-pyrophosphokinase
VPLADVAPHRTVPGAGKTVARLLREARQVSDETVSEIQARGGGVRVSNFS